MYVVTQYRKEFFLLVQSFFFFFSVTCRLFGHSGACSACGQSIPASEMVMRAQGNVYHLKVSLQHRIIFFFFWYHN